MSEVRVNNIVDYGGKGAPTFDNGAVISGISSLGDQAKIGGNVTITSGGINVSGVTTATLSGNLTGDVNAGFLTATSTVIGSGVTINAGGLNITGVMTATTFEGSGASMTGVAMTITPLAYNPDVNDGIVHPSTGIGITFDHRILAGSGNITLSIATNAGAAGTTVENFGVGSSVTIQGRKAIITPTSELDPGETFHLSYPSGAFTNTGGDVSYVGTAYTFGTKSFTYSMFGWGGNDYGVLGNNTNGDAHRQSSPTQIPGSLWNKTTKGSKGEAWASAQRSDGTLWGWGRNEFGQVGNNSTSIYSSPIQIPGTTWATVVKGQWNQLATKTDGTLWSWGYNFLGLGVGDRVKRSSPTQIPGTDWAITDGKVSTSNYHSAVIKTDGTLYTWGYNNHGQLAQNNKTQYSSPVQIPGTTWRTVSVGELATHATKTDGTLWSWGYSGRGGGGRNTNTSVSSPVQIPGTTWSEGHMLVFETALHVKTDGTLWTWGFNRYGALGTNQAHDLKISSPVQVPGTTWSTTNYHVSGNQYRVNVIKTDGTMWTWGLNSYGSLGLNQDSGAYSSPVQIPGTTWHRLGTNGLGAHAIKRA